MAKTLAQEAIALRSLKKKASELTKKAKELNAEHDAAERALMERMEKEGVEGIKASGTNFTPTSTRYSQVQDEALFQAWAKEHAPELLETKHRKGLLHDEVRRRLDDGELLPPGVGYYEDEYISQRAA